MPSRASPCVPPASPADDSVAGPAAGSAGLTGAAPRPQAGSPARADAPLRRLASDAVFAGASEVLICHRGVDYRLRQTTLGKLILTK
jgi:hemin uptake protein HemP